MMDILTSMLFADTSLYAVATFFATSKINSGARMTPTTRAGLVRAEKLACPRLIVAAEQAAESGPVVDIMLVVVEWL